MPDVPLDTLPPLSVTVDAEWWGRAHLLSQTVSPRQGIERDIEALEQLLQLFDELQVKATFFVVAHDFPAATVRKIAAAGHEIASHSLNHPHFGRIDKAQWRTEIQDSKHKLEDMTGQVVAGFRTPSWSVPYADKEVFLDLVARAGYRYDSSFCGFQNYLYGDPRFPRKPYQTDQGLWEIPLPLIGFPALPWTSGFYFRSIPLPLVRRWVRVHQPAFLCVHPWEFYPQRHAGLNLRDRFITEYGRQGNLRKLRQLLTYLQGKCLFEPLSATFQ